MFKIRLANIEVGRKIPAVRVMTTGDWHISPIVSSVQEQMLSEAIRETKPHVIILQGDMVDSPRELSRDTSLERLKSQLLLCSLAAPTVLVLGSHDYILPVNPAKVMKNALDEWRKICDECGVKLLLDDWYEDKHIRIFGAKQDDKYYLTKKHNKLIHECNPDHLTQNLKKFADDFKNLPSSKVNWFAAHSPVMEDEAILLCKNFDVMSFGHTHGGIVPRGLDDFFESRGWTFGLISPERGLFPKVACGVKKLNTGTFRIINAGMVGAQYCVSKFFQKFNFIKAAEVNIVDVRSENKKDLQ